VTGAEQGWGGGESEEGFLLRRAAGERRKIAETSCMVRSVHEELLETYEERLKEAEAGTAALQAIVRRIDEAPR
jgi:hypothetical protein